MFLQADAKAVLPPRSRRHRAARAHRFGATSLDASVLVPPRFSRLILGHGWGYLNKVWSVLIFRTLSHCVGRRPPRRRKRRSFARLNAGADAFLNFEFIETQTPCAPEAEGCERASISENSYRGSPMKSSLSLSLSLSLFFLKSGYFLKLETVSRRGLSFCMEGSLLHPARRAGVFFCELEHIM